MKLLRHGILLSGFLVVSTSLFASEGWADWLFSTKRAKGVEAATDKVYQEECGSCHFAYQPGLLPAASWAKLIDAKALEDHFGDNAELGENTRTHLAKYLEENAADTSQFKRSKKIMASLGQDQAPLRITEVPYIQKKHRKIPERLIKGNAEVKSLSACNKCHKNADQGSFDDDDVNIPGHGRWDD